MKKILAFWAVIMLSACVTNTQPDYDTNIFFVSPDVKVQQLKAFSSIREKDRHAQVSISGIPTKNQIIYYKVEWYSAEGMQVRSIMSGWNKKSMIKNVPFNWSAVSSTPKASTYRIIITKEIGSGILK